MSTTHENPPAFPRLKELRTEEGRTVIYHASYETFGMTLRDYFAGQAMQALITQQTSALGSECITLGESFRKKNNPTYGDIYAKFANHAYVVADAMLAERSRRESP